MKKKTEIYNGIHGKKRRLTWIALILIFSIITISITEAGNSTQNQTSYGTNPEKNIDANIDANSNISSPGNTASSEQKIDGNGTNSQNSSRVAYESNTGISNEAGNNSSYIKGSTEENLERKTGEQEPQETVENKTASETEVNKNQGTQKTVGNKTAAETEVNENQGTQKTVGSKTAAETEVNKNQGTQETVKNETEEGTNFLNSRFSVETKESKNEETQKTVGNKTEQDPNLLNSRFYFEIHKTEENRSNETVENKTASETEVNENQGTQKTVGNKTASETEVNENQGTQKTVGNKTASETEVNENQGTQKTVGSKTAAETEVNENQGTQKTVGSKTAAETEVNKTNEMVENTKPETEVNRTKENQETAGNKTVSETKVNRNNETAENTKPETVESRNQGTQETVGNKTVSETEVNRTKGNQETVGNKTASEAGVSKTKENQKAKDEVKENTETDKDSDESIEENDSDSLDGEGPTQELKVIDSSAPQKSVGKKTKPEAKVCNGLKIQSTENLKVKLNPEIKVCIWKTILGILKEPEVKEYNWTYIIGNKSITSEVNESAIPEANESVIPETKTDQNSWNNLKLILSYSYFIHPFYTVNDTVTLNYQGPEALGQKNVDIYLVKERNLSSPENVSSNSTNENKTSLEDILNNSNIESYIKIPATLNENGDLSPMTFGPLAAGKYRIFITLAGNETEKTESENETLLADNFEVFDHEMIVVTPYTVKEGENFDVNLSLKNAPAEKNYTYWAVLINEDAYTTDETNPGGIKVGVRPIVNGVDLIEKLENSLIGSESENEKAEINKEIQDLIGKDNGTISIGEENQTSLSMESLDLPSGNYLLLAGAYGNSDGLAGIAQKELRISDGHSYGLGLGSSSGTQTLGSSSSLKAPPSLGIKSIFGTPKAFLTEDIKPYVQTGALTEIVKNPPKVPSFLLGFAGTLLIGLAILRKKR